MYQMIGDILEVFENNISRGTGELFLFFDEIQYASNWDIWQKHFITNILPIRLCHWLHQSYSHN